MEKQTLSVQAEDLAGNKMIIQEKSFIIDTQNQGLKFKGSTMEDHIQSL